MQLRHRPGDSVGEDEADVFLDADPAGCQAAVTGIVTPAQVSVVTAKNAG